MAERVELRVDGEVTLVDVEELTERVRHARVPLDANVHHPPWTGESWRRIQDVPALQDALDFPGPRFHAHLLRRATPWLTVTLVAVLIAAGAAQLLGLRGDAEHSARMLNRLSVGWESTLLDGAWWSPWTSQLVHASVLHLIGNLTVIAYCAFRCERALGAIGLFAVLASSVAGGSALIVGFSELGCIGSSVIGFGLWGAQFAVGWRYEEWIPERWRGNYGFGTVVLTIPLFIESATSPHVSLLGHIGGWLGGVAVAMVLTPVTCAPRREVRAAAVRTLLLAALLAIAPAVTTQLLGFFPTLLSWPSERVSVNQGTVTVDLPWRHARQWRSSLTDDSLASMWQMMDDPPIWMFAAIAPTDAQPGDLGEAANALLVEAGGGALVAIPADLHRPNWTALAFQGTSTEQIEVETQMLTQDREGWTVMLGWLATGQLGPTRTRLYAHILTTAEWLPPAPPRPPSSVHESPDDSPGPPP